MLRRLVPAALVSSLALVITSTANAAFFVAGDYNGWDENANVMTDNGDGTHSLTIAGLTDGARQEFKITDGTWSTSFPGPNSWWVVNGTEITVTFEPAVNNRIGLSDEPGTWTAVGDWQGWNNGNPATAMTSLGGGVYSFQTVIATAGEHFYKAVRTGTWDAIGTDRSINAGNISFTTTEANQLVTFTVDALAGTASVVIPEPASLALIGLGGVAMLRRRSA